LGKGFARQIDRRLDQPARLEDLQLVRAQQQRNSDRRQLRQQQTRDRDCRNARGNAVEPGRHPAQADHVSISTSAANI
jgi:hypothetical protein